MHPVKSCTLQSRAYIQWVFVFPAGIVDVSLVFPACVLDHGVVGGVDHGGVVDGGEISVHQLEVEGSQHEGPDGLDLHVGEVLTDTPVATWRRKHKSEMTNSSTCVRFFFSPQTSASRCIGDCPGVIHQTI